MAKKRQSTGLPKPRPTAKPETASDTGSTTKNKARPLREHKSRAEREAEMQRQLILWISIAVGIVILLVGVALFVNLVYNPGRTVASVNGEKITVSEYQDRVRLERGFTNEQIGALIYSYVDLGYGTVDDVLNLLYQNDQNFRASLDELSAPDRLGLRVLNAMIDETLIRQQAEERGITVTEEEIDAEVETFLGIDRENDPALIDPEATPEATPEALPTATITPTPLVSATPTLAPTATLTPEISATPSLTPFPSSTPSPTPERAERLEEIDDVIGTFYRAVSRDAEVSRAQIRDYFRTQALRKKLAREVLEVPETAVWVNARHILVQTEEEARNIIDALNAGESFAALARVSSLDTTSGQQGGELGWTNSYGFVPGFREAVREQELGAISQEPVETDFGFHIIQVREREDRDIEESEVDAVLEEEFTAWLETYRETEADVTTSDFWPDVVPADPPFNLRSR